MTEKNTKTHNSGAWVASVTGAFTVINTAVQQFGWPGVILCGIGWFIVEYATPVQKQRLIDMYALGQGTPYVVILVCVLFVVVLFAQHALYTRKLKEQSNRSAQVEAEKDRLHAQLREASARLQQMEVKRASAAAGRK